MVGTRGEISLLVPTFFCSWPLYLAEKGYLPTTVRNMMTNVTLFIRHMKCSFQAVSKVRSPDFNKLLYELKMLQMNVHKHVVVHRQKVMKKKTGNSFFIVLLLCIYSVI